MIDNNKKKNITRKDLLNSFFNGDNNMDDGMLQKYQTLKQSQRNSQLPSLYNTFIPYLSERNELGHLNFLENSMRSPNKSLASLISPQQRLLKGVSVDQLQNEQKQRLSLTKHSPYVSKCLQQIIVKKLQQIPYLTTETVKLTDKINSFMTLNNSQIIENQFNPNKMMSIFKNKPGKAFPTNIQTEISEKNKIKLIKNKKISTNFEIGKYNIENYTDFCHKRNPSWKINETNNYLFSPQNAYQIKELDKNQNQQQQQQQFNKFHLEQRIDELNDKQALQFINRFKMKKNDPILIADTAKNERLKKLSMQLQNVGDLSEKWNTKMQISKQLAKKIREELQN